MDGVLVICKEKGYTSHDVVAKLRGILHMKKIGHTGTLDPDAEGVLPVVLGKATKLADMLTEKEKTYEAVLHLGIVTDTQDMTGTVLFEAQPEEDEEKIRQAVESFLGPQMQVPPMYSALKVDGKKLYELAREGKTVERAPRQVQFYSIDILEIKPPLVSFRVTCSKGTYIRTLCHDIGQKLGCGGCMEKLVRTKTGRFSMEEALTLSQVEKMAGEGTIAEKVIGLETVLAEYPAVHSLMEADRLLENGNSVKEKDTADPLITEGWVRMYTSRDWFVGIYAWEPKRRRYSPVKMFL